MKRFIFVMTLVAAFIVAAVIQPAMAENHNKAYLEITLKISDQNRDKAAGVYKKYKEPFLKKISGAESKELLIRGEDVQVLHGFSSKAQAEAYLESDFFTNDVVKELSPLFEAPPEIRVYEAM